MIDAPYVAAERVFAAAITERVEFVVLAGTSFMSIAPVRDVAFLIDQFQRLAAKKSPYWAGGTAERRGPWPDGLRLPENVHPFSPGAASTHAHCRRRCPGSAARTERSQSYGKKRPRIARQAEGGAVRHRHRAHGGSRGRVGKSNLDYWACGGAHRHRKITGKQTIYFSGSPQGRTPADRGRHGALLVAVDEQAAVQTRFLATDMARFERLRSLDPAAPASEQQRLMAEKVEALRARAAGVDLFLRVQIVPTHPLPTNQSREGWAAEWLASAAARVRHRFAGGLDRLSGRRRTKANCRLRPPRAACWPSSWHRSTRFVAIRLICRCWRVLTPRSTIRHSPRCCELTMLMNVAACCGWPRG